MKKDELSKEEIDAVNRKLKSSSSSSSSLSTSSNRKKKSSSSESSSCSSSWTTFSVPSWVDKNESILQPAVNQKFNWELAQIQSELSKNKISYKKGLMKKPKLNEGNPPCQKQISFNFDQPVSGPFTIMKDYSKMRKQEKKQSADDKQEIKKRRGRPRKDSNWFQQNMQEEDVSDIIHLNDGENEFAKQPSLSVEVKESSSNSTQNDTKQDSNARISKNQNFNRFDASEDQVNLDFNWIKSEVKFDEFQWADNYYQRKNIPESIDFANPISRFNQNTRGPYRDYTREYTLMVYRFAHEYHQSINRPKKVNFEKNTDQGIENEESGHINEKLASNSYNFKEFQVQEIVKNFDIYDEAFKTFINWWMNKIDSFKQIEDSFYENEILFTKDIDNTHIYLTPKYKEIYVLKAKDILWLEKQISTILGLVDEHQQPLGERKETNYDDKSNKITPSWKLKVFKKEGDSSVTFTWSHHDPSRKSRWLNNHERESKYTLKLRNNKDGVTGWRFALKFTRFCNVPHSFNYSYSIEKIQPLHNHELYFQGVAKWWEPVTHSDAKYRDNQNLVVKKRSRKEQQKEIENVTEATAVIDDGIGISKDDLFNKENPAQPELQI